MLVSGSVKEGRRMRGKGPGIICPAALPPLLAACLLAMALTPFSAAGAKAQTPPSAADLRIYAGLHAAAAKGDAAEIERLAGAGENLDVQDANSRTPLHVAAFLGRREAARALLKRGANPNALDAQKYDIVTIVAVINDVPMLKIALAGGASARNITSPYDGTALIAAAHLGHAEIVRTLIAANAPLDHVNNLGWTALIESIVLGDGGRNHTETLDALVKAGANVNIPDRQGVTPLGHARQRGYAEMVRILEAAGAR
jgi:ankyrin repeat protein